MMRHLRPVRFLATWYIYVALAALWLGACAASPFFRTMSTLGDILLSTVPIALIGLGQTAVVLSRGFDLSVGAVASMATAVASVTMRQGLLPSVVLITTIALLIGLLNGIGATKFGIDPFIMTLSMMFIISGVNLLIRPSPGGFIPEGYKRLLLFKIGDFPVTAAIILALAGAVGYVLLQKRRFGRAIYAVGGDHEGARRSGIDPDTTRIAVFMTSALCSALAGLFIAARIGSGNATVGDSYLFDSFTTVFMGGTLVSGGVGGYGGTLVASLIIASLGRILQFLGITTWYQFIIKGLLLVGVAGTQLYFARKGSEAR